MSEAGRHPASYRDPSGYVFVQEGQVFRAVAPSGKPDYDTLMQGGLYEILVKENSLLPHTEMPGAEGLYKILLPEQIVFQSYAYEWSFEQLKAAALLTLRICRKALEHGMMLKDATPYNIVFHRGKPVLIDTLSFERYSEGDPWKAFRQFCESFLYPLLLQHSHAGITNAILLAWPEGIPAATTASLLPGRTRLSFNHQLYVHLPARLTGRKQAAVATKAAKVPKTKLLQNIAQLEGFIRKLQPKADTSEWRNYYEETLLSNEYLEDKKRRVAEAFDLAGLNAEQSVTDLGANTGVFSLMASERCGTVIAADIDTLAIDRLYLHCRSERITNIYPVVADLALPSPGIGWNNREHSPLLPRLKATMVLALALVHHLAIGRNVPLLFIARLLADCSEAWAIAEFVPKGDEKVSILLQHREDVFDGYTAEDFEQSLEAYFSVEQSWTLAGSSRVLYLLRKR